jgi:hypothetical protein
VDAIVYSADLQKLFSLSSTTGGLEDKMNKSTSAEFTSQLVLSVVIAAIRKGMKDKVWLLLLTITRA